MLVCIGEIGFELRRMCYYHELNFFIFVAYIQYTYIRVEDWELVYFKRILITKQLDEFDENISMPINLDLGEVFNFKQG